MVCRFVTIVLFVALFFSCKPADRYQDKFWIIADSANIYERPDITAKAMGTLKLGAEVFCRDKNPSYSISKAWVEAKSGEVYGFMERKWIAGEALHGEIGSLIDGSKDMPVQAAGLVERKAALRLKPERGAFIIKLFKDRGRADVLERVVIRLGEKEKAKRQVWYRVRLEDGRAGFIAKSSLELVPPAELNGYTSVRVPVSWYKLQEKEDPVTGEKGSDYLVTYSAVGSDLDTDFTRIELYTYDLKSKQYATNLARSGLYGILPVKIADMENDGKTIEIREHPKGDKNKVRVIQYSFPSPVKVVKEWVEEVERE